MLRAAHGFGSRIRSAGRRSLAGDHRYPAVVLNYDFTIIRRIALCAALGLLAVSCGSDDASDNADNTSTATSEAGTGEGSGSSDVKDLTSKPPIDADLLGSVDELITTDIVEGDGAVAVAGSFVSMQYVGVLLSD